MRSQKSNSLDILFESVEAKHSFAEREQEECFRKLEEEARLVAAEAQIKNAQRIRKYNAELFPHKDCIQQNPRKRFCSTNTKETCSSPLKIYRKSGVQEQDKPPGSLVQQGLEVFVDNEGSESDCSEPGYAATSIEQGCSELVEEPAAEEIILLREVQACELCHDQGGVQTFMINHFFCSLL